MASARSTLYAVMLVSLLGTAGIALPYPVLSPFFMETGSENAITRFLGIHPKILLGILLALYPLGILIGSPFVGALSDVLGRRRVLAITLLIAGLSYGLSGYAVTAESYLLLALSRMLTGLCESNIAVSRAIALDLHPDIDRTRALSLVFATNYAGWLVGPLAGAYIMPFGVDTVFYVGGLVTLVAIVPVHLAIIETRSREPRETSIWHAISRDNSLSLVKISAVRLILPFHFLYTLSLNAFYEFYPLWLVDRFSFGSERIGWATVAITFAMILSSVYVVTPLSRRFDNLLLIWVGSLALGATFMLMPVAGELGVYPFFFASGAIIGVTNGLFPSYMAERFESHGQGRVMGLLMTSFCISSVLMALTGSFIALLGTGWSLFTGGVLGSLAALWFRLRVANAPRSVPGRSS